MEVAIVGGGLAGAVTALWCQHRGLDVRILERRRRAGTTLCGEGLSGRALDALAPVFDARPFVDRSFRGARWRFPGTTVFVHRTCHTMAREDWIPAMLEAFEARGGTVEYGTRGEAVDADHVVGADGPGSRTRARVGGRVQTRTGIQARVETDAATPWLEFVTDKQFSQEYAWWFPRDGVHNIGLLAEQDGDDEARLAAFIEHLGIEARVCTTEAYPIAFGGDRVQSPDGDVSLIGDAAGLTNPVTKGGIAAIVHAAPILADALARGRPMLYAQRLRRHPLRHPSYLRALRRLRRWSNDDLRHRLAAAPDEVHVGGPGTRWKPIAAGAALRRPWTLPAMADFYQATVRSVDWSW